MRSRTTEVKFNFRGQHETFECDVCHEEDENQEHLIKCTQINKHKKNEENLPDYEKLFENNLKDQIEIAKGFIENLKIRN